MSWEIIITVMPSSRLSFSISAYISAVDFGIKPGNRLVQKQHFPCGAQRTGKQHPLLLPAGQLPIAPLCKLRDLHLFHRSRRKLLFFFAVKGTAATASLTPGENDFSHGCREVLLDTCVCCGR